MSGRVRKPLLRRRGLWWTVGSLVGVVAATATAFVVSPWPGSLLVRNVFEQNGARVLKAMEKHAPAGVEYVEDIQYRPDDRDALLDLYFPEGTDAQLPTVVWIHGGAWISGGEADDVPYFKIIAAEGYTVAGVDYSLAPERTYPTAVHQLNDALAYLVENAERLHIDPDRIVLAGDSAGAQLASQLAVLTTSPDYAAELQLSPALADHQLRGVVLNCGIYDLSRLVGGSGLVGWGADESMWAYTGSRNFTDSPVLQQMSTINHVTAAHPPAYISGGNGDPLTAVQSKPLAQRLADLDVDVTTLFWPEDHTPALPHEYQFDLDTSEGQTAPQATLNFIGQRLR